MASHYVVVASQLMAQFAKAISSFATIINEADLETTPREILDQVEGYLYYTQSPSVTDLLEKLPALKVLTIPSVGYDYLDLAPLKTRGVAVGRQGPASAPGVAEYAVLLLLACSRSLIPAVRSLKEDENPPTGSTAPSLQPLSDEVTGSTVGIVGMGNIGYQIARKLSGFDVKILYKNRNKRSEEVEKAVNATFCESLSDLLSQSDYVVIALPSSPETVKLIGAEQFHLMKNSAYIINVSRGIIIDQDAMVEALRQGQIHGAALDVTEPEPLPKDHPLLNMANVIVTPHIAWATQATTQRIIHAIADNMKAGLEGKPLPYPVPF